MPAPREDTEAERIGSIGTAGAGAGDNSDARIDSGVHTTMMTVAAADNCLEGA